MARKAHRLRIGAFLAVSVLLLVVGVFLLGGKHGLFKRKLKLRASFENAAGLVVGSPVRLAGIDVGTVEQIGFATELGERRVHVELGIARRYAPRIRADSVARLSSKGLLGDAVVDISIGSFDQPQLHDGDTLRTVESPGVAELTDAALKAIREITALAETTRGRIEAVTSDQMVSDLNRTLHDIAEIAEEAKRGRGLVHTLLSDRQLARQVRAIGDSAALAAQELSQTVHSVHDDVDHGRGTLGALIKDPTLYEDMKLLVGNARRHRLLRALIRYTIRHDGLKAVAPKKE